MRTVLAIVAVALGAVALLLGAGYILTLPTTLRLAVPDHDTASRRLFETAAENFKTQRLPIRLAIVSAPDSAAALIALEKGNADLAVARAEDVLRAKAQTALIVRQEAAVIITAKNGKVKKFANLVGANIGVVREGPANTNAFAALINYYGIDPMKLRPIPLAPADIGAAMRERRVDVLIVVGDPTSKRVADAVADAARNTRGGIRVLEVEAAEAISKRVPELDEVEFKQGIFGGAPPLPTESVTSIGSSIRLVANERLSDERVSDLLRQLLAARQSLGAVLPGAGLIKLPSTDEVSTFVIHPGVLSYGTGEIKSFFDRYGDWLYLGLFIASGIGSAFAGAVGWLNTQRRQKILSKVFEIEHLLDRAGSAETLDELADIERRAGEIFRLALKQAVAGELDDAGLATFQLAWSEARSRIEARRLALASAAAGEEPGRLIAFTPAAVSSGGSGAS